VDDEDEDENDFMIMLSRWYAFGETGWDRMGQNRTGQERTGGGRAVTKAAGRMRWW